MEGSYFLEMVVGVEDVTDCFCWELEKETSKPISESTKSCELESEQLEEEAVVQIFRLKKNI